MAWTNEIALSGSASRDAQRNSDRAPWRFCLIQRGGKKKDGSGFWPDEYFDVASFHATGGEVKRGMDVTVRGRLRQEQWEGSDGEKRKRLCIIAAEIVLPTQPAQAQEPKAAPPITPHYEIPARPARPQTVAAARPITEADPITDEDIPW